MEIDRERVLKTLRAVKPEGVRVDELGQLLAADPRGRHRLRRLLAELIEEGAIEKAPGSRYRLAGLAAPIAGGLASAGSALRPGQVAGKLRVHPAGYGFVVREDGEVDVFVPARYRSNALDGDRVALTTWAGYKGTEGRVEAVLARGRAKVTGILRGSGRGLHLDPDDPRIQATSGLVSLEGGSNGGKEGQAVVAEIIRYPESEGAPLWARVTHVLGDPDDPRTEVEKVLISGDIPTEFPEDVEAEARSAPTRVEPDDLVDRIDLRDHIFLTIDPETARDFDDAVCIEPSPRARHTRLWVAVADVSHYVRPGKPIDREARLRGCSVYLPDRAIPMLPRQLSSEICSLNPEVDRLALVARMEIDEKGGVADPYFCAAVIRSRARLDYAGVAAALDGDLRGARERYREHLPTLEAMRELSGRLRTLRAQRGSLDFDLPEAKVLLDEDDPKRVRDVVQSRADPRVKGAYQIVEDFMLAANEAVARFFRDRQLDTVWRVHDIPSEERLVQFAEIAQAFGLKFDPEDGRDPRKLRQFLDTLAGRSPQVVRALNFLLLRALKQAQYDVVNVGHFGLGASDYLHFTSPIRRYPDLIVHRLIKHALRSDGLAAGGPAALPPERPELQAMAAESSSHERRAMEAEREVVDMYRAFLMRDHVGEQYEGTVSGVTAFGLFIQIESPFVEGLIKSDTLGDDTYELDEQSLRLSGRRTGRTFSLGDKVRVEIANVSVQRRKIDLLLEEHVPVHSDLPPLPRDGKRPRHSERHAEAARGRKGPGRPERDRKGRPDRKGRSDKKRPRAPRR